MLYDLLIRGGKLYDGTGNPWYRADVAVSSGKIARIAADIPAREADRVIDAADLAVSPGFVDMHAHDDTFYLLDPVNIHKLSQGVTTVVSGNCGVTLFPISDATKHQVALYAGGLGFSPVIDWHEFSEFSEYAFRGGAATNMAYLVGHGTVRIAVMGMDDREPSSAEIAAMQALIRNAMRQGAVGLSSGLIYPPGVYAKPDELIQLSRPLREFGGVYVTHMRNEGSGVLESIDETLAIARGAGVPVHISHHKVSGKLNWGKSTLTLAKIQAARDEGLDVTADAYPYTAGSTFLAAILPPFLHVGGEAEIMKRLTDPTVRAEARHWIERRSDWQNFIGSMDGDLTSIVIAGCPDEKRYEGRSIRAIADEEGKEPLEALFDIVMRLGYKATAVIFVMDETDMERIIKAPFVAVGSDALPDTGKGVPHPRGYGSFARVLGPFVRDRHLMSLEEAVRKMTSMPAARYGMAGKGLLKPGCDADITIFDPTTITDTATYASPRGKASGIVKVIVGGEVAYENNEPTGVLNGRLISNR